MKVRLVLLLIPNVILASDSTVSISEKIKVIEDERDNNLESIKKQLEDIGKLEHFEFHKEALEKQFDEIITNIKCDKKIVNNLENNISSDVLYWYRGGTIHYKPTAYSHNTTVMEYYDRQGTKQLVDKWINEPHLKSIRDWKSFVISKVLPNVGGKIGFAFGIFYDLDDISKYLSKKGLVDAYYSSSGSAIIHYYIGPSSIDSSAVAWTWKDYPIVIKPSSDYYDIIRYHEN